MDLNKVRKALGTQSVIAGEPGTLDPAVPPQGGTHDTDIEIADDVVKLVDTNSPNTPDLETRAYQSGTDDDGTSGPPYDGDSSVDGLPTIPETLAGNAGESQKNNGGGGPSVQLPDTLEEDLSVAPNDPHASASLTTADVADLRQIMAETPKVNVGRAVNALLWLDQNIQHPKHNEVKAGLDKWSPSVSDAKEAQARFGFAYLHTAAAAGTPAQTNKILAWLKSYLVGKKLSIASEFLQGADAQQNPALAAQVRSWYKATAVDQVRENKEDVGLEDITLYGPQNGAPEHRPSTGDGGFTEPKVVSLDDVPFLDPERHAAQAGSEVDDQTASPAQDSNAVDSDSFSAKNDDRAKEANLPTAAAGPVSMGPMGLGCGGQEGEAPPVPGLPPEAPEAPIAPLIPELPAAPVAPAAPVVPEAPVAPVAPELPGLELDPAAAPQMPGEMPGEMPELPPVLPEGDPELGLPAEQGLGAPGAPGAPGLAGDEEMGLEEWLKEELMEPENQAPAESAHVEMLSHFNELGQVTTDDVVMALYGEDQDNPHWNIDIAGRPVARVELADQPSPEEVRSTFLSAAYAESIAQAMAKVGPAEVLSAIKAKPYAARIETGALAQKIRAKVEAEYATALAEKVGALRDRFLTAAKIALSGYNNNFFRGEDHQLKAAIWSELKNLGVRDASRVIESAFDEGSVPFFERVLAKAEELMDLPDEARDAIAKAIPEANSLVAASADTGREIPSYETMASHLESGNMPFTNPAAPVTASRSDVCGALRSRVQLSTFRSS